MVAVNQEAGIFTLAKEALDSVDDETLAFEQWKAWIIEDQRLLDQALHKAWVIYRGNVNRDIRRGVTNIAQGKKVSKQRQQSSAFGLVDVARQSTESIYAWIVPYADVDLRQARRSDLAKAEDALVKTINTQTWQCLFVRELRAGLKNELETVPDRFSESDIERMMERAHTAVYRRNAEQAAN